MQQLTIFDLIEPTYPDFHSLSEKELVEIIGKELGLTFKHNAYLETYEAKIGKAKVQVNIGVYTDSEGEFISTSVSNNVGGCAIPCDSIESAVRMLRKYIDQYKEGG